MLVYPVYRETEKTPLQFTIDGRIGAVFYFDDISSASQFFLEVFRKIPAAHIQLNDLGSVFTVAVSLFTKSLPPSRLRSLFFKSELFKKSFVEEAESILSIAEIHPGGYPDLLEAFSGYERRHVFKLKRNLVVTSLLDNLEEVYEEGICLVKIPTDDNIRALYYTSTSLGVMIRKRLFCAEYVDAFKYRSFYLWLPMAANFYLVDLFKL